MTYVLRAARASDLAAIFEMAKTTGGGFTNLPPDENKLAAKLSISDAAFARADDGINSDMFFFILENSETGDACGTCQIFSSIGKTWPFYSYRIDSFATYSRDLDRSIETEMLTLSTDLSGCCEVGGLFLHPAHRAAGVGGLLARSRYLYIRNHRSRFADQTVAELRGKVDEAGHSPFWDALAGRFFGLGFREADEFNAVHGNQFIADLMPRNPIYTKLLSDTAREVIGMPHVSGRAAMRMLEKEGFLFEKYVDIFDGGPTLTSATDEIATIRNAQDGNLIAISDEVRGGVDAIVTYGRNGEFRACYGIISTVEGGVVLDRVAANALGAAPGDHITYVAR